MLIFLCLVEEFYGLTSRVADCERIIERGAADVIDGVRVGAQFMDQVKNTFITVGLRCLHQRCYTAMRLTLNK